jgi:hypothetical protein
MIKVRTTIFSNVICREILTRITRPRPVETTIKVDSAEAIGYANQHRNCVQHLDIKCRYSARTQLVNIPYAQATPSFTPIFSGFSPVTFGFYRTAFANHPRIILTSTGNVPQITHSKPEPRQ